MHLIEIWRLALKGLTRRKVRTLLTALGIAVAVASMVIFLSLGEGIRRVFVNGRSIERTPCMAARLTDHPWTVEELLRFRVSSPKKAA